MTNEITMPELCWPASDSSSSCQVLRLRVSELETELRETRRTAALERYTLKKDLLAVLGVNV